MSAWPRRTMVTLAVLASAGLGAAALASTEDVETALTERSWFVQDVSQEGDTTTVRLAWTDSYFAANACREARAAADDAPLARVRIAFGDAEPRACTEIVADPLASIASPPASEDESG